MTEFLLSDSNAKDGGDAQLTGEQSQHLSLLDLTTGVSQSRPDGQGEPASLLPMTGDRVTPAASMSLASMSLVSMPKSDSDPMALEKAREAENRTVLEEGFHSLSYSLVQSPVKALAQIGDQTIGKPFDSNFAGSVEFMDAPVERQFNTSRWYAQHAGGALGMLPWFVGVAKLTGSGGRQGARMLETRGMMTAAQREAIAASNFARPVAHGFTAGFAYGSLLVPTAPEEGNFLLARGKHGLVEGLTFGGLTLGMGVSKYAGRAIGDNLLGRAMGKNVVAATLAGGPAGVINADASSQLFLGRSATWEERGKGAYTMGVMSAFLVGGHEVMARTAPRVSRAVNLDAMFPRIKPAETTSLVARESGPGPQEVLAAKVRSSAAPTETAMRVLDRITGEVVPETSLASNRGNLTVMGIPEGQAHVFQKGVNLAGEAVRTNSEAGLTAFAQAEGAGHGRPLLEFAHLVNRPELIRIVETAYKVDPTTSNSIRGEALARTASEPGATTEMVARFFEYAQKEGAGEGTNLIQYAEILGDSRMAAIVREGYLVAQNRGVIEGPAEIDAGIQIRQSQVEPFKEFLEMSRELHRDPTRHAEQRQKMLEWLDQHPDLHEAAIKYARNSKYVQTAAIIDYRFDTRLAAEFPSILEATTGIRSGEVADPHLVERTVERGETLVPERTAEPGKTAEGAQVAAREFSDFMRFFESPKTPTEKLSSARQLANHIGKMTPEQFRSWLSYLYEVPQGQGVANLHKLRISNSKLLESMREVFESDPTGQALEPYRRFLAEQPTEPSPLPEWVMDHYRQQVSDVLMENPNAAPHEVLNNALPRWLIQRIKGEHVSKGNLESGGEPIYSEVLQPEVANLLEAARHTEPPPRGKPRRDPTPERDRLSDRLTRMEELRQLEDPALLRELRQHEDAAVAKDLAVNEQVMHDISTRLFELGSEHTPALRSILQKLQPDQPAAYRHLLQIVLPEAKSIHDVRMLLDAVDNGNYTRRKFPDSQNVVSNRNLALSALDVILEPTNPRFDMAVDFVNGLIDGKYRGPQLGFDRGGRGRGGDRGRRQGNDQRGRRESRQEQTEGREQQGRDQTRQEGTEVRDETQVKEPVREEGTQLREDNAGTERRNAEVVKEETDATTNPPERTRTEGDAQPDGQGTKVKDLFDFSEPPKTDMERAMREAFLKAEQERSEGGKKKRESRRRVDDPGEQDNSGRPQPKQERGGARNWRDWLDEADD